MFIIINIKSMGVLWIILHASVQEYGLSLLPSAAQNINNNKHVIFLLTWVPPVTVSDPRDKEMREKRLDRNLGAWRWEGF